MTWKEFISLKQKRFELISTLILLSVVLFSLTRFLIFIESRNGFSFEDPLLKLFEPIDLTWLTFTLIYGSIITAIFYLISKPEKLLFTIQLYTLMVVVRIIAMWLLPLNPPEKMITLVDPFVEFFGTGKTLTKDLFFSGHTATLFILFLTTDSKYLKLFFLICTIGVAVSVLLQHVHYSIDVFAAVIITYACYSILKLKTIRISNGKY
ncbi:MAG: phosphatase PAP2 family protein [Ignavibacterium album]|jgi:membrane-associated phospholipid phosphatase|uniref:phosphatase PAP2 family protein n=1 Tax=Ignavibacterium album TaxID=591197 RepID=UPI0026F139ED|nr:phosphatase PAP2 family protein [Ignavibacterium album]MCX8106238.1 phosphatase PAP2 family protein [Ignavibacterium album]